MSYTFGADQEATTDALGTPRPEPKGRWCAMCGVFQGEFRAYGVSLTNGYWLWAWYSATPLPTSNCPHSDIQRSLSEPPAAAVQ